MGGGVPGATVLAVSSVEHPLSQACSAAVNTLRSS